MMVDLRLEHLLLRALLALFIFLSLMGNVMPQQSETFPPFYRSYMPRHRQQRETEACQPVLFGNVTHSKHSAASPQTSSEAPLVETHYRLAEVGESHWDKRPVTVLHQVVNYPLTTLSILEPGRPGSCQNGTDGRTLVRETATQNQCIVAINAGLFNTHTGPCLGNIVSNGRLVQSSGGIINAHIGLTKDGYIYTGYLSEMDLLTEDFTQLVGGVMWLVRDGVSQVDASLKVECPDTQETGSLERFTTVVSARTAIGHDADGRVHMVEVNGKTDKRGVNLYEMAEMLIGMGLVNAINLDGGGSATAVINGTLVNYPSDQCEDKYYNCERPVTTVVCIHAPYCQPRDCSGHGSCDQGTCRCQGLWEGPACDKLKCPGDCTWHGVCTEGGCKCHLGWSGDNCSLPCPVGFYGANCSLPCYCQSGASCNPKTGECLCAPGFSGKYCQTACPVGFYGEACRQVCFCEDSCFCDPVSGNCTDPSDIDTEYMKAGQCIASRDIKKQNLVPSSEEQSGMWLTTVVCLSTLGVSSLLLNTLLSLTLLRSRRLHQAQVKRQARLAVKRALRRAARGNARQNSENDDEDDDDDEEGENIEFKEEPLTSSSDDERQRHKKTSSNTKGAAKAKPVRQDKSPKLMKLQSVWHPLKGVRRKGKRPNVKAEGINNGVRRPANEQLVPLLGWETNRKVGNSVVEYTSSDKGEEDELFVAPHPNSGRRSVDSR